MSLASSLGSSGVRSNLAYPSEAIHFKLIQGQSLTVDESKSGISPSSGQVSGIPVTGAVIYAVDCNDAGFVPMRTFKPRTVYPGQTIAVAVAANVMTVTVDGVNVYRLVGAALTAASAMFFIQ